LERRLEMTAFKKEFLAYISCLVGSVMMLLFVVSCATAKPKPLIPMESVYLCPNGHSIPLSVVNKDIRAINSCPTCGAQFPCLEPVRAVEADGGGSYYRRGYYPSSFGYSDTEYERLDAGNFKSKETSWGYSETWWRYHGSRVKRNYIRTHWTTNRYHYP